MRFVDSQVQEQLGPAAKGVAVANHEVAMGDSGDDVARLVALTERQHELWALLRDAKDEQLRNQLFDELTENREELARLKESVSAQVDKPIRQPLPKTPPETPPKTPPKIPTPPQDQPRSVGEELRSKILTPTEDVAPSQPPPPPPPPRTPPPRASQPPPPAPTPAQPPPSPDAEPAPVPEDVKPQPRPEPAPELEKPSEPAPAATKRPLRPESDDALSPESTPFRSREDDLAATRGHKEPPRRTAEPPRPRPVDDGVLEERRRSAHEAYQEMERVRVSRPRSFPIFAILVAVAAVAIVAWYVFIFNSSEPAATTPTTTTTLAPEVAAVSPVPQIQAVIDGLGVGSIMVEESDGSIYLIGVVDSETDRAAVVGATEALAGEYTVDAVGLVLSAADEELRLAALQAIADAGFDKINVAVVGGVATLTGVTPDGGATGLVAAVVAVDGIEQVVDLTETTDRAAALEDELDRITAVTPIVFDSGQVDLTTFQERILDNAAEVILAYDGPIVTVVGYTDAAGSAEENQRISELRGERVRDYLVTQGVPAERLLVEGRGEATSSGSTSVAGLERRVEFEVGYAVSVGGDADFRIGIVAPSASNDLAFTQSIVDAVEVIAGERGGVGVDVSDGLFVIDDAEAAIRAYAGDGFDLVIAHGSQYGTLLSQIAAEFPNTAFAWGTAADTFDLPNVSAYEVAADEGGYVLGAIAARLTSSNVIGVVGPIEVGDAKLFVDGFRTGAVASDPGISVLTTYTGSFSDVALAAGAADGHVAAGADVLTGSAQMVVGAVGVAAENDALWFGNQANQAELAPELVVASQVYHWEVALREIVTGIDSGDLGGATYQLDLANGGIVIEYNPGYDLPTDVADVAAAVVANIIAGTVVTGG